MRALLSRVNSSVVLKLPPFFPSAISITTTTRTAFAALTFRSIARNSRATRCPGHAGGGTARIGNNNNGPKRIAASFGITDVGSRACGDSPRRPGQPAYLRLKISGSTCGLSLNCLYVSVTSTISFSTTRRHLSGSRDLAFSHNVTFISSLPPSFRS